MNPKFKLLMILVTSVIASVAIAETPNSSMPAKCNLAVIELATSLTLASGPATECAKIKNLTKKCACYDDLRKKIAELAQCADSEAQKFSAEALVKIAAAITTLQNKLGCI